MTSFRHFGTAAVALAALAAAAAGQTTYTFNPVNGANTTYAWGNANFWTPTVNAPPGDPPGGDVARFDSAVGGYSVGVEMTYQLRAVQFGAGQTGPVSLLSGGSNPTSPPLLALTPAAGAAGTVAERTTLVVEAGSGNHTSGVGLRLNGPANGNHVWDVQGGSFTLTAAVTGSSGTGLTKTGAGTLNLNGNSFVSGAFDGTLTVSGGRVNANNASFSTGLGPVVVGSGGTLGGRGTINVTGSGGVSVDAGGTLTGGTGAGAAALAVNAGGGTSMAAGSTLRAFLFGTGAANLSRVNVTGEAAVDAAAFLVLDLNNASAAQAAALRSEVGVGNTRTYTILRATEGLSDGGFSTGGFTVENRGAFQPGEFAFGQYVPTEGDGPGTSAGFVTVTFTPVPEPGAVLAVAAGVLALGRLARRRQAAV